MTPTQMTPLSLSAYLTNLPSDVQDLPIMIEDWTEGSCTPCLLTDSGIMVYREPTGSGGNNVSNIDEPCVLFTAHD